MSAVRKQAISSVRDQSAPQPVRSARSWTTPPWSRLLLEDHEGLRMLSTLFGREADADRRREYLRLALDLHVVQEELEDACLRLPELQRFKLAVEDLAQQVDSVDPRTKLTDARGAAWFSQLEELMAQEESRFADGATPRLQPAASLLRRRQALHDRLVAMRH